VDLVRVGTILDRAARCVELLRMRLQVAGEVPGPEPIAVERELIAALREVRALRIRRKRRTRCFRERS
jgi:hypothetical protein